MKRDDFYKIGRIGKPHGVKGEVGFMFDDDVFDRVESDYLVLEVDGLLVPFFMEEYRFKGSQTALVKFCDVDSQDAARELTGCDVYFPRSASDGEDGEMTWASIVGFHIVDINSGADVGEICGVDDSTINLLLEIKTDDGQEILIPAHDELIENVDAERRVIEMRLPEGLTTL